MTCFQILLKHQAKLLQIVEPAELETVKSQFTSGQTDLNRSLVTGNPVGETAAYAVSGGRLYAFANRTEALNFDNQLAELDAKPGPFAASSLLADSSYTVSNGSIDLARVQSVAIAQATSWTETKKKLFLIRVNFTDRPEEPVSLSSVESVMSQSSEMIRKMSYGKTWVEARASVNVYTMPQTMAYYSSSPSMLATEPMLMLDARNTFRQQKFGADAEVNIGAVSSTMASDGSDLGDYDIVGMYRCTADGESAGGGAGGSFLLIKGAWANTIGLFTHEWGHNYGLGHSSLWKSTDGTVAGEGVNDEYGDPFDVMGTGRMPEGHFHPEGKVRLNWLPASRWVDADISGSGTYRISRIDGTTTPQKIHGIRVARGGNGTANGYYWVAHRFSFMDNPLLQHGANLLWQRPGQYRSWLLDATPGSPGESRDSPFAMGTTFADPLLHAYITPIGSGGSGEDSYLDVRVNLGPFPNNTPPQSTEISGPMTVQARTPVSYSISGSDQDGDELAYSWQVDDTTPVATSNSPRFQTSWSIGGNYNLTVMVSDMKGGVVKKTMNVEVVDPIDHLSTVNVGRAVSLVDAKEGNGVVLALGYWGELFLSWDGTHWSEIQHRTGLVNWTKLTFGRGLFVLSGQRNEETMTRIAYSKDGRQWTMAQVPDGVPIAKALAYGGGKFVAACDGGAVLWSSDGMNWVKFSIPAIGSKDITDIAWAPVGYVITAVSYSPSTANQVFTSSDRVTWTDRSVGIGVDATWKTLLRTAWLNDRFVAGGYFSGIRSSLDGGKTFEQARTAGNIELRTMAYGNGIYFGAGWDRDNNSVDVDVFSLNGNDWYAFTTGTSNDRLGAVFFKHTFITVGDSGEIRQSGEVVRPKDVFALQQVGNVTWDGKDSVIRHSFLSLPSQSRVIEYSSDLDGPWQILLEPVETGPLGRFEATFRQSGDLRQTWGKRMFFRLQP